MSQNYCPIQINKYSAIGLKVIHSCIETQLQLLDTARKQHKVEMQRRKCKSDLFYSKKKTVRKKRTIPASFFIILF